MSHEKIIEAFLQRLGELALQRIHEIREEVEESTSSNDLQQLFKEYEQLNSCLVQLEKATDKRFWMERIFSILREESNQQ